MSEEIKVQLKGPQAILAILVLIGAGGFQWVRLGVSWPGGGPDTAIKSWIANEYSGELAEALDEEMAKEIKDVDVKKLMAAVAKEQATNNVDVTKMSARRTGKNKYVVRIEFLLGNEPPPDGKGTRYLRITKRSSGGWFVDNESSAFTYYSSFF